MDKFQQAFYKPRLSYIILWL